MKKIYFVYYFLGYTLFVALLVPMIVRKIIFDAPNLSIGTIVSILALTIIPFFIGYRKSPEFRGKFLAASMTAITVALIAIIVFFTIYDSAECTDMCGFGVAVGLFVAAALGVSATVLNIMNFVIFRKLMLPGHYKLLGYISFAVFVLLLVANYYTFLTFE